MYECACTFNESKKCALDKIKYVPLSSLTTHYNTQNITPLPFMVCSGIFLCLCMQFLLIIKLTIYMKHVGLQHNIKRTTNQLTFVYIQRHKFIHMYVHTYVCVYVNMLLTMYSHTVMWNYSYIDVYELHTFMSVYINVI